MFLYFSDSAFGLHCVSKALGFVWFWFGFGFVSCSFWVWLLSLPGKQFYHIFLSEGDFLFASSSFQTQISDVQGSLCLLALEVRISCLPQVEHPYAMKNANKCFFSKRFLKSHFLAIYTGHHSLDSSYRHIAFQKHFRLCPLVPIPTPFYPSPPIP